jgi:hypothetical protein
MTDDASAIGLPQPSTTVKHMVSQSQGRRGALAATSLSPATAGAILLARIRAVGSASANVPVDVLAAATVAAAAVDRRLVEVTHPAGSDRVLVLGWAEGTGPDADQHPSAPPRQLSPVPCLVWAVCLSAAWPDPLDAPYPGHSFLRAQVLAGSVQLGADRDAVVTALDKTLPESGLITAQGSVRRLGPAAAALPSVVWSALRRVHDRLPRLELGEEPGPITAAPADDPGTVRTLPAPSPPPLGSNESAVRAAVAALETAPGPVPRTDLPTLADPAIRRAIEDSLAGCGRTLLATPDGRWTTGYPDHVADALVEAEAGTLTRIERAVLALVLLWTVAIPRAHGRHHHNRWEGEQGVSVEQLDTNRQLPRTVIAAGLRRLRAVGYIRLTGSGYVPGPSLARLSETRAAALWEDLVVLGRPDGHLAAAIRARRQRADQSPDTQARAVTPPSSKDRS